MENTCVLTFYSAQLDGADNFDYQDAWEKCIVAKADGVFCRNVFHIDMPPSELSRLLRTENGFKESLLDAIHSEYLGGAVLMFVQPQVGAPIDGFYIDEFLGSNGESHLH